MDVDDMTLFREALNSALNASGVLGKVRAQLRFAAIETLKGSGNARDEAAKAGALFGVHPLQLEDRATVLAHALVLDFLASQPSLSLSRGIYEEEAAVDRIPNTLQTRDGVAEAIGIASTSSEPMLVALLRRGGSAVSLSDGGTENRHREPSPPRPSFTVAAASRWPVPTKRGPGKIESEPLDWSDVTADSKAAQQLEDDWDAVETVADASVPAAAESVRHPVTDVQDLIHGGGGGGGLSDYSSDDDGF